MNDAYICALTRFSCSSARSTGCASEVGAIIPAATHEVPPPSSPRSSTVTSRPLWAARHATARPIGPPPMTTTSEDLVEFGMLTSSAGITRVRFRRSADLAPPSQPASGLPLRSILARRSCQTCSVSVRHDRLQDAHLYLICEDLPDAFLSAAIAGGVD